MQQKYIQDKLLWCTKTYCKPHNNEEFKFLFLTVNLLEKLIECGNFNKAEKILQKNIWQKLQNVLILNHIS